MLLHPSVIVDVSSPIHSYLDESYPTLAVVVGTQDEVGRHGCGRRFETLFSMQMNGEKEEV